MGLSPFSDFFLVNIVFRLNRPAGSSHDEQKVTTNAKGRAGAFAIEMSTYLERLANTNMLV